MLLLFAKQEGLTVQHLYLRGMWHLPGQSVAVLNDHATELRSALK